ncbi:MAG: N-acetylmuramoyl-L-alanine amidase [Saprospiraceae bacterium]|nr:N-acetylmuramoyl-L-alanine amidase [Saprospiraceae bacterium]
MNLKIALRTLSLLAAWLVLQNFNVAEKHTAETTGLRVASGKSMDFPHFTNLLSPSTHPTYRIKKVVLDAGHGGKDPGCIGAISKEKDNALAIVLKLGEMIKGAFPEVEVIYTRKTDEFIELNERAAIANRNKADLFISVHCNAVKAPHIHGAETYVMGLHTADHNLEVAKRENSVIFYEKDYQKNYEGYDPNSPEAHIIGSVWQSAYLEQSILFASFVQQFARTTASRVDKGVKQAGFLVLRETAMPSVLIETGFLTNRTEEEYIASEEGQAQIAQAIFEAFEAYKQHVEGAEAEQKKANAQKIAATSKQPASTSPKNGGVAPPPAVSTPTTSKPSQTTNTPASTAANTQKQPSKTAAANTSNTPPKTQTPKTVTPPAATAEPVGPFRIFLISWPMRMDTNTGQMALLGDVVEEKLENNYYYFTGRFDTLQEAEQILPEIKNLGFRTAAIVSAR